MWRKFADRAGRFAAVGALALVSACASTNAQRGDGERAVAADAMKSYAQALELMQAQRHAQAVPVLETLAQEQPTLSGPQVNLGIAYAALGRDADAERVLRRAVEINAGNVAAWNELGMVQRRAGRFEEARESYARALAVDPDYAPAQLNAAILYDLYLQRPADALPHYQRYRELAGAGDTRVDHWIADLTKRLPQANGAAREKQP